MNCIRCGKKYEGNNKVFCPECCQVLRQYPENHDMPLLQPRQPYVPARAKRTESNAEIIQRLQKKLSQMRLALCLLAVFCFLLVTFTATMELQRRYSATQVIGQNYSTVEPPETIDTADAPGTADAAESADDSSVTKVIGSAETEE